MSRVPGTFKNQPGRLVRARSQNAQLAEAMQINIGALTAEAWCVDDCTIMVSRDPTPAGYRWHMSIAHPKRYPTWDEIKAAAYGLEQLQGVMLAQVFTPGDGSPWVNIHDNCFHLYEIRDEALQQ